MKDKYRQFLESKRVLAEACGFEVKRSALNPMLFDFQKDIVLWALKRGKAAVFAHTGLGKGPIQLEWCRHVHEHTRGNVLQLAPLAVAQQFRREAAKFGVPVTICREQSDVQPGINITNYERMDKFDIEHFAGVSCDESSCIRDWTSKTTATLIERLKNVPYKLCSTATPSPNDHAELGTHAELLDVMTRTQMLSMFFEHDGGETSKWVLKGHGKKPFFKFTASWAVCLKKPSDLGYPDEGFDLPPLNLYEHIVKVDHSINTDGMLFRAPDMSATGLHREMRLTADDRAKRAAELVGQKPESPWLLWCNTDYEADAIQKHVPHIVEIRGSHSPERKEQAAVDFVEGRIGRLASKGDIYGYGLNLQNCADMTVYVDYSFEKVFQIIRRCWRFGQTKPVNAHIIVAETEGAILETIRRKESQYEELQLEMNLAMREEQLAQRGKSTKRDHAMTMEVPKWLR